MMRSTILTFGLAFIFIGLINNCNAQTISKITDPTTYNINAPIDIEAIIANKITTIK